MPVPHVEPDHARLEHGLRDQGELEVYAESIVETVREPLLVLNSVLQILSANKSFYQTFKVTPEETLGNFIYDLGNRQWDIPKLRVLFEEILPHETVLNDYEVEHDFVDIGHKVILLNAREILKDNVSSHVILLAMEDITERRRADITLAENKLELEELNRSLEARIAEAVDELRLKDNVMLLEYRQALMGQLVNNIAHQWRQPLNTLALVLQQLPVYYERGTFSVEVLKENTRQGMGLIQHMSRTIDDFRNFFRADELEVVFDLDQMVTRSLALIESSLKEHKIEVARHLEGSPSANGYANRYSQALLNILMNARDALIAKRAGAPLISIRIFSQAGAAVVTITDNAGGIPEEIMGRLFDPYFTTKGPDKGIGIGLYMSKTIIEQHIGGSLSVQNAEGGAQFRIEVPGL
jgi:C4-dicarboxylate-specific signal transduction histidine kinase